MDNMLVIIGAVATAAAVLSLWTYAGVLFSERQYFWAAMSTVAGSTLLFLALAGIDMADDLWDE